MLDRLVLDVKGQRQKVIVGYFNAWPTELGVFLTNARRRCLLAGFAQLDIILVRLILTGKESPLQW